MSGSAATKPGARVNRSWKYAGSTVRVRLSAMSATSPSWSKKATTAGVLVPGMAMAVPALGCSEISAVAPEPTMAGSSLPSMIFTEMVCVTVLSPSVADTSTSIVAGPPARSKSA